MKYGSVCSGIEAATHAWHPLGWEASFFSEIEKFPRQVLAHHYPNTPLHGDFTTIQKGDYDPIQLLVGGTPCQSFSVAGLRAGLNDPRGNLMLEFGALAKRLQPKWLVWENVPGVLSSNGGRDFGSFLAMLGELGYGFAYRILDAQHFGVPQRRRRVFVVGCLGDWRSSAAVLFEQHSLQGHIAESKGKGKEVTGTLTRGFGDRGLDLDQIAGGAYEIRTFAPYDKSGTLLSRDYKGIDSYDHSKMAITYSLAGNTIGKQPENGGNGNGYDESGVSYTLTKTDVHAVAHTVGFDAYNNSVTGNVAKTVDTGSDYHHVPNVFQSVAYNITFCDANGTRKDRVNGGLYVNETDISNTITSAGVGTNVAHVFKVRGGCEGGGKGYLGSDEQAFTLSTGTDQQLFHKMQVRRLMPIECERLQGFRDDFTNIPGASDSTRYKALGNSMAVPVMKWIGERINLVESLQK